MEARVALASLVLAASSLAGAFAWVDDGSAGTA
jgi:hypothetical protein